MYRQFNKQWLCCIAFEARAIQMSSRISWPTSLSSLIYHRMSHPVGWIAPNARVVIFKYTKRNTFLEIVSVDAVWRTGPTKGFRLKYLALYFPKHRQTLQSSYDSSSSSVLNDTFVDGTMPAPCYMCTPLTLCGPVIDCSRPCVILHLCTGSVLTARLCHRCIPSLTMRAWPVLIVTYIFYNAYQAWFQIPSQASISSNMQYLPAVLF